MRENSHFETKEIVCVVFMGLQKHLTRLASLLRMYDVDGKILVLRVY